METLVKGHIAACAFLTGLIWLVQLVHYPSFAFVAPEKFAEFHAFHSRSITWIVMPIMCFELGSGFYLALKMPGQFWKWQLLLVGGTWLATAFLSVPLHNALAGGFSLDLIGRLVLTNWVRTFLWTLRIALFLVF